MQWRFISLHTLQREIRIFRIDYVNPIFVDQCSDESSCKRTCGVRSYLRKVLKHCEAHEDIKRLTTHSLTTLTILRSIDHEREYDVWIQ